MTSKHLNRDSESQIADPSGADSIGPIFRRAKENPILSARDLPFKAAAVLNPGAAEHNSEIVLLLRVEDVDSKRGVLRVRGKGDRERITMLSTRLLAHLREYWQEQRPGRGEAWLFPGMSPRHFLSPSAVRTVFRQAATHAGLPRKVTPHCLRHSFATHLIQLGVDVTVVQALLGHRSLVSTEKYVHVSARQVLGTQSPFDLLGTDKARVLG